MEKVLQFFSLCRSQFETSGEALQSKTARSRVGGLPKQFSNCETRLGLMMEIVKPSSWTSVALGPPITGVRS